MSTVLFCLLLIGVVTGLLWWYYDQKGALTPMDHFAAKRAWEIKSVDVPPLTEFPEPALVAKVAVPPQLQKRKPRKKTATKKKATKKGK